MKRRQEELLMLLFKRAKPVRVKKKAKKKVAKKRVKA